MRPGVCPETAIVMVSIGVTRVSPDRRGKESRRRRNQNGTRLKKPAKQSGCDSCDPFSNGCRKFEKNANTIGLKYAQIHNIGDVGYIRSVIQTGGENLLTFVRKMLRGKYIGPYEI